MPRQPPVLHLPPTPPKTPLGFLEVSGHLRAALPFPESGQGSVQQCPQPSSPVAGKKYRVLRWGSLCAGQWSRQPVRGEVARPLLRFICCREDVRGSREAPGKPAPGGGRAAGWSGGGGRKGEGGEAGGDRRAAKGGGGS